MFLALLSAVLLTTSCLNVNLGNHQGKKIKASKTIVTKEMTPGAFDKLNVNVVAQVKFVQTEGEDCHVVLTAPDNYVALFSIESKKGELDIEYVKDNINIESKKVKIVVYGPQLTELENAGVASVSADTLRCQSLKIDNSGVGEIHLRGLSATALKVDCSGVGNIMLEGQAEAAEMDCSGVGSILASRLKARSVDAEVSGVGGIECFASEAISGEVSGVGSLKYAGHPKSKNLNRSGVGSLSEM